MKKVRVKRFKKVKLAMLCAVMVLVFAEILHVFNQTIEPQLQAIAKQHTGFAINNIVKEVLSDMEYKSDDLLKVERDGQNQITSVEYDSAKLNQILYSALNTIDASLLAAEDGKEDPKTKQVFYEDGVLYEVPLGYFTKSYLFYDRGPKVKVRMKMLNDVTGEIKTETKPYGINNTMVKISLVIHVQAQVITFLGVSDYECKMELPVIIQIVNGDVPQVTPYTLS